MTDFDSLRARRARALRAAQVVTLSASLASLAACGGGTDTPDAFEVTTPDAFTPSDVSVGRESGVPSEDTGPLAMDAPAASGDAPAPSGDAPAPSGDAFAAADAVSSDDAYDFDGGCGPDFPPTNQPCCVLAGGFWDGETSFCAIAVPGPFVPPTMEA